MATVKIPFVRSDSLPNLNYIRLTSPSKSTFVSDSADALSTTVLRKRPSQKRVRFALKLESVEESSLPSKQKIWTSIVSKPNRRVVEPWRPNAALYGAYVEYLGKQDESTNADLSFRQIPPPPPPPPPESGAEPPTYAHTFVIQSKSPEMVIDSITVSSPPNHLPHILYHTRKPAKQQLPTLDLLLKQKLKLSNSSYIIDTKKATNSSNQNNPPPSSIKRSELNFPSMNGLYSNNKITRIDNTFGSKPINDHIQPKKLPEIFARPLPALNNQINHFSDRSILPNYPKKPSMYNRTTYANDGLNTNIPYFYQNHDNDHLIQPIIHSTH